MNQTTIALATDLTADDDDALVVAAALAARSGARLVSVHATTSDTDAKVSPPVRELSERWGTPIDHVPIMHGGFDDVTETVLDALKQLAPSLVVAGTQSRAGWIQLFAASVAEGIARNIDVPTLIVPHRGRPMVDTRDGRFDLARMVLPVADARAAEVGVRAADWLRREARVDETELVLLHVGDERSMPTVPSARPGLRLESRCVPGRLEDTIVQVADGFDAAVLIMPTRGRDTLLDALSGSHTERVLRRARRPVLLVPF